MIVVGNESSLGRGQLSGEMRSLSQVYQVVERSSLSLVQNQRKRHAHARTHAHGDVLIASYFVLLHRNSE